MRMETHRTTLSPLHGVALCSDCGSAWYSALFLDPEAVTASSCGDCGSGLEPVPAEPFGEGPLHVPAEWVRLGSR